MLSIGDNGRGSKEGEEKTSTHSEQDSPTDPNTSRHRSQSREELPFVYKEEKGRISEELFEKQKQNELTESKPARCPSDG